MTLHEKLLELATRLSESGQKDDAATVFAAAMHTAPAAHACQPEKWSCGAGSWK
jgi:hypothetical protein